MKSRDKVSQEKGNFAVPPKTSVNQIVGTDQSTGLNDQQKYLKDPKAQTNAHIQIHEDPIFINKRPPHNDYQINEMKSVSETQELEEDSPSAHLQSRQQQ